MIHVALLGYGTVGSGVAEIIEKNCKELSERCSDEVEVKYILDLRDFPGDPNENKVVHDISIIENDPEIDIAVEAMGGIGKAYEFTKALLSRSVSVCTSNKAVVAEYGVELLKIAKENHCSYLFEASVGGGIPILRPLKDCLGAERIEGITGILNGTTNYMLTKMDEEGCEYDAVLKEAQAKGYAEQNPEADVCGHDACRKIAILSSLAMGKTVNYKNVHTEGITNIGKNDFEYAKKLNCSIKLLGLSRDIDGKCLAIVAPFMVSKDSPLYGVRGVFNGIMVKGNMVGDTLFYGQGAGKLATASAIVSDIVECANNKGKTIECPWKDEDVEFVPDEKKKFEYFIRVKREDLNKISECIGVKDTVSIDSLNDEIGVVSEKVSEVKFYEMKNRFEGSIVNFVRFL
ncbi:MAG: homoserine dehydrogenase [Lachnospiraceae bacterium]|nr:homoserine dehydrogenase [Lachnospiraceae bacterium]